MGTKTCFHVVKGNVNEGPKEEGPREVRGGGLSGDLCRQAPKTLSCYFETGRQKDLCLCQGFRGNRPSKRPTVVKAGRAEGKSGNPP